MDRPYILVNVAASADGKIDSIARGGASISSSDDKRRVDELRASVDAVLVGGRTLLADDPRLTLKSADLRAVRLRKGMPENPAKVGVVTIANLEPDSLFMSTGPARRLIYTTIRTAATQIARLREAGAEVFVQDGERVDLASMLDSLRELGIRSVLIEGGGTLISELFRLGLVDELTIYIAPLILGGANAPTVTDGPGFLPGQAPALELVSAQKFDTDGGVLLRYRLSHISI